MGEAKRRKLMDSSFGKPLTKNFAFLDETQQNKQAITRFPYPKLPDFYREGWLSAAKEVCAVDDKLKDNWHVSDYQKGLYLLLQGVLTASGRNDVTEEGIELIKQAGNLLEQSGGARDMYEACSIWVPKHFQRLVDMLWNGIGEWKS